MPPVVEPQQSLTSAAAPILWLAAISFVVGFGGYLFVGLN